MGAAAFGVYHGLYVLCKSNAISVLAACIAAVIVYGVALLVLKGLTEEELLGFPERPYTGQNCEKASPDVE